MKTNNNIDSMWEAIIRPPREQYALNDLVLRRDFHLKNSRGHSLACSIFEPFNTIKSSMPFLLYLHGNCGSRMTALEVVQHVLPMNIKLFCFDFAGCGHSEGEYISVGWYETEDVLKIIKYLQVVEKAESVAIWGRSMGAVVALMAHARNKDIACLILDSPFCNLKQLCNELAMKYSSLPGFLTNILWYFLKRKIMQKIGVDLEWMDTVSFGDQCTAPVVFICGANDDLVSVEHAERLVERYKGNCKECVVIEGDHNSYRPKYIMEQCVKFVYESCKKFEKKKNKFSLKSFFEKSDEKEEKKEYEDVLKQLSINSIFKEKKKKKTSIFGQFFDEEKSENFMRKSVNYQSLKTAFQQLDLNCVKTITEESCFESFENKNLEKSRSEGKFNLNITREEGQIEKIDNYLWKNKEGVKKL